MKYKIYIIKNLIEKNKIYIGCTKKNLNERMNEHIKFSKINIDRNLYKSFNELGIENFKIELIEEVNKEEAKEKENFYIKKFKEIFILYNKTLSNFQKEIFSYNLESNKITKFNNLKEAETLGFNIGKISQIVNESFNLKEYKRILHKNCLWSYENSKENWNKLILINKNKKGQKIKIINTTTNEIFDSIAEANIYYGLKRKSTAISNHLKKNTKSCLGFKFQYLK